MRLKNLNYATWCQNHNEDHPAAWFRQFYPFTVFSLIDFSESLINKSQTISFGKIDFHVRLSSINLQDNGRYKSVLSFSNQLHSKRQEWDNRSWNCEFEFIYTQDGHFITVYTKDLDPTKSAIIDSRKNRFDKLNTLKSAQLSDILIQSFVLDVADVAFPNGMQNNDFEWLEEGVNPILEHPGIKLKRINFFSPLYSIGRDFWICYAFNEEKAHRIGIYNGNQCKKLVVVFVNPTPTRHHRCKYPNVQVISFHKYCSLSREISISHQSQIRFLQNHMNLLPPHRYRHVVEREIAEPKFQQYDIKKSEIRESMSIMKMLPDTNEQMFYYLAAMNLINAWIGLNKRSTSSSVNKLFKNMFFFKTYLANALSEQIETKSILGELTVSHGLIMVEVLGYQFSFHSVPMNKSLETFEGSSSNIRREWRGLRLQPIAPLILELGRCVCPEGLTRAAYQTP